MVASGQTELYPALWENSRCAGVLSAVELAVIASAGCIRSLKRPLCYCGGIFARVLRRMHPRRRANEVDPEMQVSENSPLKLKRG